MGTALAGSGVRLRRASVRTSEGASAGRMMTVPRTAAEMETANVGVNGPGVPLSDDAQQLSASACETTCFSRESEEPDLCIGQESGPEQHAMRASAVADHPAQTARFPASSARVSATAESRRHKVTTRVGCPTGRVHVKCRSSDEALHSCRTASHSSGHPAG